MSIQRRDCKSLRPSRDTNSGEEDSDYCSLYIPWGMSSSLSLPCSFGCPNCLVFMFLPFLFCYYCFPSSFPFTLPFLRCLHLIFSFYFILHFPRTTMACKAKSCMFWNTKKRFNSLPGSPTSSKHIAFCKGKATTLNSYTLASKRRSVFVKSSK